LLVLPCNSFAQALPAPDPEQQYLELIEQREEDGGITAPELIEPLVAIGEYYYEQQNYERAAESFERARTIMRVNTGFDTPQELPLLARQVASEEARGNVVVAWELEQSLLQLARQNISKLESVPIFVAAAEKRFDVWERYRTGDHPPEIELGCYYDRSRYIGGMMLRMPVPVVTLSRENCGAGERNTAMVALLLDARTNLLFGIESLLQNDRYAGEELMQLVVEVLRTSQVISRRLLSTSDPALAGLMQRLLAYAPKDSADAVRRAEFLLQLADMNVVRARQARRMSGFAAVHEQYEQAWQALEAEGFESEALQELFAPAVPIVLPSYAANPLNRVTEAEATGYIDVSFRITDKGTTRSVEILESSAGVARSDIRQLRQLIDQSSFRPRMEAGKVVDMVPVTVRYFVSNPVSNPVSTPVPELD
jgi:hypothetical protein